MHCRQARAQFVLFLVFGSWSPLSSRCTKQSGIIPQALCNICERLLNDLQELKNSQRKSCNSEYMQYITMGKSCTVAWYDNSQCCKVRQADGGSVLCSFKAGYVRARAVARRGARLIKTHAERASEREADIFAPTE